LIVRPTKSLASVNSPAVLFTRMLTTLTFNATSSTTTFYARKDANVCAAPAAYDSGIVSAAHVAAKSLSNLNS